MKSTHRHCDTCFVNFRRNAADPFCKLCPACVRRKEATKRAPAHERKASQQSSARDQYNRSVDPVSGVTVDWHSTQVLLTEKDAQPTRKGGDILRRVEGRLR